MEVENEGVGGIFNTKVSCLEIKTSTALSLVLKNIKYQMPNGGKCVIFQMQSKQKKLVVCDGSLYFISLDLSFVNKDLLHTNRHF